MDYACGRLSLDGDKGTDFRVPDFLTMERGVAVIAAAPGTVRATRDGMADVSVRKMRTIGLESIKGREAGNGVVIDHGGGWETQYNHLKQGSVAVRPGARVEAGQRLGLIGLSGNTEYPHVEFSVRHNGEPVDPFVGTAPFKACGDPRQMLWSAAVLAQLEYRPTWPLLAGFATERPDADAARHGAYSKDRLARDALALVFWADISGAQKGDHQRFRIMGPDDQSVHERESMLEENNISWFAFSGAERPDGGWSPGTYRGTYTLERNGTAVATISKDIVVE